MIRRKPVSPEVWIEIEFHLKRLIEVGESIQKTSSVLPSQLEEDLESATTTLAGLEVDIFFLLEYHIKHLRRPFRQLTRLTYQMLDQAEKAARGKNAKRQSSKSPAAKRPISSSKKARQRVPSREKK